MGWQRDLLLRDLTFTFYFSFKVYKALSKLKMMQWTNERRTWRAISLKSMYRCQINKWKDVQHLRGMQIKTAVSYLSLLLKQLKWWFSSVHFSTVAQSCLTLWDPMTRSTPGFPVHHKLPEFTQTHAHGVGDAIQPFHPLSSPSPPAPNPSQHQGLFQWVNSSHEVAKVLAFQLQHKSFQWTPRPDLL